MLCKNCGKDVPYAGKICPYCHTDKGESKKLDTKVVLLLLVGFSVSAIFFYNELFTIGVVTVLVTFLVGLLVMMISVHGDKSTPTQTIYRPNVAPPSRPNVAPQRSHPQPVPSYEPKLKLKKQVKIESFDVTCPHCKSILEADSTMAGQSLNCPSCGKSIQFE